MEKTISYSNRGRSPRWVGQAPPAGDEVPSLPGTSLDPPRADVGHIERTSGVPWKGERPLGHLRSGAAAPCVGPSTSRSDGRPVSRPPWFSYRWAREWAGDILGDDLRAERGQGSGASPAASGGGANFECAEYDSFGIQGSVARMEVDGGCLSGSGGFAMALWDIKQATDNTTYGTLHQNNKTCPNISVCVTTTEWDCGSCHGRWVTTTQIWITAPTADPFTSVSPGWNSSTNTGGKLNSRWMAYCRTVGAITT